KRARPKGSAPTRERPRHLALADLLMRLATRPACTGSLADPGQGLSAHDAVVVRILPCAPHDEAIVCALRSTSLVNLWLALSTKSIRHEDEAGRTAKPSAVWPTHLFRRRWRGRKSPCIGANRQGREHVSGWCDNACATGPPSIGHLVRLRS